MNFINLTEFCERVGMSQLGSIPATVAEIESVYGVKPLGWLEGKAASGDLFYRPLFTKEQAAMVAVIREQLSELSRFDGLKKYFAEGRK